jgi:hypothetical protein
MPMPQELRRDGSSWFLRSKYRKRMLKSTN